MKKVVIENPTYNPTFYIVVDSRYKAYAGQPPETKAFERKAQALADRLNKELGRNEYFVLTNSYGNLD